MRAAGRSISTRPPRASISSRRRREQRLEAAARVAEHLPARLRALDLAAHGQLAPQPGHRDVLRAVAELAAQQRAPHLLPGLACPSRARSSRAPCAPRTGPPPCGGAGASAPPGPSAPARAATAARSAAGRAGVVNGWLAPSAKKATLDGRHSIRRHAELVGTASAMCAVAGEQVVVVALQQHAVAHVEAWPPGRRARASARSTSTSHARLGQLVAPPSGRPPRRRCTATPAHALAPPGHDRHAVAEVGPHQAVGHAERPAGRDRRRAPAAASSPPGARGSSAR